VGHGLFAIAVHEFTNFCAFRSLEENNLNLSNKRTFNDEKLAFPSEPALAKTEPSLL